jgi:hypothetical protein
LINGEPSSFFTGAIHDTVTAPFPAGGAGDAAAGSSSSEPLQLAIVKHNVATQSRRIRATLISFPE